MLLDTRLQNGEISYQNEDIVKWIDGWKPSDQQVARLRNQHASIPEAEVVFIACGNGVVTYSVTPKNADDRNGCSSLLSCLTRCLRRSRTVTTTCLLFVVHCLVFVCGWMMRAIGFR